MSLRSFVPFRSFLALRPPLLRTTNAIPSRSFRSSILLRSSNPGAEPSRGLSSHFSLPRLLGVLFFGAATASVLEYERQNKAEKAREKELDQKRQIVEEGEEKPAANLAAMGGPFSLVDEEGARRTQEDFLGKFMLLYFGYTFCPDICPSELKKMAEALDILESEEDAEEIKKLIVPIFVSVDPHRDSLPQIKRYTKEFHPRLLGMTGTEEELKVIAKAYGVYIQMPNSEERAKDVEYMVDHSIFTFMVGPDGKLVDYFSHEMTSKAMAKSMARKLRQWRDKQAAAA